MKQGVMVLLCLFCVFLFCVPVFAQPSTKSVETVLIDDFDSAEEKDYQWDVQASRFVADGFPKKGYFKGIPNSLRGFYGDGGTEALVLGVQTSFNRKGDNWFEIFPTTTDENGEIANYEIPFKGVVSQIDFWVWGSNYKYVLEVLVRDADGRVHTLPVGVLLFNGWKNFVVNIPGHIRQESRLRSGPKNMTFVGFKVRTDPNEYVDNFNIYFDNLKYTTHTLSTIYDGFDLRDIDFDSANEEGK